MWASVLSLSTAGDLDGAEHVALRMLGRFPEGQTTDRVRAFLDSLAEERVSARLAIARQSLEAGNLAEARRVFQEVVSQTQFPRLSAAAREGLDEVASREAQAAARRIGFIMEDVETYWQTNRDTLGGQSLIQPELRFYVRPAGSAALNYL
jgi:hypothetical protein